MTSTDLLGPYRPRRTEIVGPNCGRRPEKIGLDCTLGTARLSLVEGPSLFISTQLNSSYLSLSTLLFYPFLYKMTEVTSSGGAIKLKLKSKDGAAFEVDKAVATQINFVKGMLEGMWHHSFHLFIPVTNVYIMV